MALVKRNRQETAEASPDAVPEKPSVETLVAALGSADAAHRRQAARQLASHPDAAPAMCGCLDGERDASVRSVLFTSLIKLKTREVVGLLLPHLRSEDAALRNAVIEALQDMPDEVEPFMEALLADEDSDVRIFAVNVLSALPHERTPYWLTEVIQIDPHVNVCAAAVDCLAEIGNEMSVAALAALTRRFPDEPFIEFAVSAAIRRIKGE